MGQNSRIIEYFVLLFSGRASLSHGHGARGGQEGGAQAVHGEHGGRGGGAADLAPEPCVPL